MTQVGHHASEQRTSITVAYRRLQGDTVELNLGARRFPKLFINCYHNYYHKLFNIIHKYTYYYLKLYAFNVMIFVSRVTHIIRVFKIVSSIPLSVRPKAPAESFVIMQLF